MHWKRIINNRSKSVRNQERNIDKKFILKTKMQNYLSKLSSKLSAYFCSTCSRFSFPLMSILYDCPAGFSAPSSDDREQDLVSRTSESYDFLRNDEQHGVIRTCASSCMRRNGRTHRKMTVGLF